MHRGLFDADPRDGLWPLDTRTAVLGSELRCCSATLGAGLQYNDGTFPQFASMWRDPVMKAAQSDSELSLRMGSVAQIP